MLGTTKLHAVLQVWSHQSRAEGGNHLPGPAGHPAFDVAQDLVGFLSCEHTLPAYVEFFVHIHA